MLLSSCIDNEISAVVEEEMSIETYISLQVWNIKDRCID